MSLWYLKRNPIVSEMPEIMACVHVFSLVQDNNSGAHKPTMELKATYIQKMFLSMLKILMSRITHKMNFFPFRICENSLISA